MSRGYALRRVERIERIADRIDFLLGRIAANGRKHPDRDTAEVSALKWALEEIERFDEVEAKVWDDDIDDSSRLLDLEELMRKRHRPSAADRERTKGLART